MKVHEVMTTEVISVSPETSVKEVAKLLRDHHIGGVPVVGKQGEILGILGEADLMPKEMPLPFTRITVPSLFKKVVSKEGLDLEELYRDMQNTAADQIMETDVITVDADDDVGQACWLLAHHHIKRLPVLRDGKLVGMIARTDIIRILASDLEKS